MTGSSRATKNDGDQAANPGTRSRFGSCRQGKSAASGRHGVACGGALDRTAEKAHSVVGVSFAENDHHSLGIICKTQKQADLVYQHLRGEVGVRLIDADSKVFSGGVIISTAYLAKGLEFDQIIVPFCSESEYGSAIDQHMLYVAVTRAMHTLTITHTGKITPFLRMQAPRCEL